MRPLSPAEQVLDDLLTDGAILVITQGRLQLDAPPGVLTPARRTEIAQHRVELRTLVGQRWRNREACRARRPCRRMGPCLEPVEDRPCGVLVTCCLCGAPLHAGRRLLCPACSHTCFTDQRPSERGGSK